ncbi:hypothetical protein Baya_10997 [Bagarius yarrelli]|uniref:Uncharacterized protein n=1 Tax=Bagarius yarrelli TaxID=175774 RepID=A0A556UYL9_BAGYA|nr:hypothetical protein Baya_10997 [Bagarius yarrelli]
MECMGLRGLFEKRPNRPGCICVCNGVLGYEDIVRVSPYPKRCDRTIPHHCGTIITQGKKSRPHGNPCDSAKLAAMGKKGAEGVGCSGVEKCQTSPEKSNAATSEPSEEMPSIQIKPEPEEVECTVFIIPISPHTLAHRTVIRLLADLTQDTKASTAVQNLNNTPEAV